jgi:hypothetical protein
MAKSLKEQNRWQIWLLILINSIILYGVTQTDAVRFADLCSIFTDVSKLVPVTLAVGIATVLNGQLDANTKARLVFLRWHYPLPGHRAFSRHMHADARLDPAAVEKLVGTPLPSDPAAQNRVWFKVYQSVKDEAAVLQVHRDFLLTRDFTGLATLMIVFYGGAAFFAAPTVKAALLYLTVLVAEYLVMRQAASRYGIRMVTTVLACATGDRGSAARHPFRKGKMSPEATGIA